MQTISLDISSKGVVPTIYAKQGDVGRKFKAVLTDAGVTYAIPRGAQFSVWYSGASGEGNYSAIGDTSAFAVEENVVTVELITQMVTNSGTGTMCLILSGADGSQIGLWNITYVVEAVPGIGSEAAKNYYTALSEVAEKAVRAAETFQTDPTLKISGRAADAEATGVALAGKAPARYGLGESEARLETWANVDSLTKCGWYYFESGGGFNGMMFTHSYMRVDALNGGNLSQTLYPVTGENLALTRQRYNSTWGEWEWVNPPMRVGVEYRTTERYNGKVVYTKLLNVGNLVSNAGKTIDIGVTATNIVDFAVMVHGSTGDSLLPMFTTDGSVMAQAWASNTSITIYCNSDLTSRTAVAHIKYTKD